MKILIPDHIPQEITEKIKEISNEIEVLRLKIIEKENIARRILRKTTSHILSYNIYKKLNFLYQPKKRYSFFIGKEKVNGQLENTKIFLASWAINHDAFRDLLGYLPDLKWVHSTKTGIDHLSDPRLRERNILLTSSKGVHSSRIAEFVMACIFELSKRISEHICLTRTREWKELQSIELEGKLIGILGTGGLGTAIAKKAKGLGMKTIGCIRTIKQNPYFDEILETAQLSQVLKESDFLVVCLPLTGETEGLIGEKELAMMKPSAYIINVARSRIINEDALIKALSQNRIAGAILDVFHPEMQLPNHPFYKLDNVILTHYSAHASATSNYESLEIFVRNIKLYIENKPLNNIVDLTSPLGAKPQIL